MATIAAENKVIADLWIGSIKTAIRASKDFLIACIILTPSPHPFFPRRIYIWADMKFGLRIHW